MNTPTLTLDPAYGKDHGAVCHVAQPLSLKVNMNHIPALAEERERLWTQVGAADFLSREEKRAMVGIEETENNQTG